MSEDVIKASVLVLVSEIHIFPNINLNYESKSPFKKSISVPQALSVLRTDFEFKSKFEFQDQCRFLKQTSSRNYFYPKNKSSESILVSLK